MTVVGSVEALNALPIGSTLCDTGCHERLLEACRGYAWVKQVNGEWHLYIDGKRSARPEVTPTRGIVTPDDTRNLENLASWSLSKHEGLHFYRIAEEDDLT